MCKTGKGRKERAPFGQLGPMHGSGSARLASPGDEPGEPGDPPSTARQLTGQIAVSEVASLSFMQPILMWCGMVHLRA